MKIPQLEQIQLYNLEDAKPRKAQGMEVIKPIKVRPSFDYSVRQNFQPSEFNLAEVGIIEDVEGYVRQCFQKKCALMFKEGEELRGENKAVIQYIKRRLNQIEVATQRSWRELLRETGYYLLSRSNFFWVIVRDQKSSGGQKVNGKQPIAGYFALAPETMECRKDIKTGQILMWRQHMPDGRFREFFPDEIHHFYAYRKTGFTFGTPTIIPVKDDIRALRRIEENVELLIYQTLFPIFHYKVGTELKPAATVRLPNGEVMDEVEYVKMRIATMPSEGGIVTPERHEIEYIGAEGKALKAREYLDYFKMRVFAGLGASSVDFGEGDTANRATADNMSRILVDSVKDFQDILAEFINHYVILPLLKESTFKLDLFDEENLVQFRFKEIDIETQMKKNVNSQLMYNGNMIDIHEARKVTGHEPLMPDQEKGMFSRRVTIPEIKVKTGSAESIAQMTIDNQQEMQKKDHKHEIATAPPEGDPNEAAMKAHVAAATTTTKTSRGGGKTTKSVTKVNQRVHNRIKAMSAPSNQHGQKTGPQKSKLDSFDLDDVEYVNDTVAQKHWSAMKSDIVKHLQKGQLDTSWIHSLAAITLAGVRDRYLKIIEGEVVDGLRSFGVKPTPDLLGKGRAYFVPKLTGYTNSLTQVLRAKLQVELDKTYKGISVKELTSNITDIIDSMEYRLKFFDNTERMKAYNVGRVLALKHSGQLAAGVKLNDDCEGCKQEDSLIDLNFLSYDDIAPHHSNCDCPVNNSGFTKEEQGCILRNKRDLRGKNPTWSAQRLTSEAIATYKSSVGKE